MPKRSILLLVLLLIYCGKKGAPTPPDRFPPTLEELRVMDRNHITLGFSEELDTFLLTAENFTVLNTQKETLKVFAVAPFLGLDQIVLTASRLESLTYFIRGSIRDLAGNVCEIEEEFVGSTIEDSIAPRLIDYPSMIRSNRLYLKFSEALDTASLKFILVPRSKQGLLVRWDKGLRQIDFYTSVESDSFIKDSIYHFFIYQAKDFNQNSIKPFHFFFTPDSIAPRYYLRGEVYQDDKLVDGALVVARIKKKAVAMAISDRGQFSMAVKHDEPYDVEVFYDGYYAMSKAEINGSIKLTLVEGEMPSYEDIFK